MVAQKTKTILIIEDDADLQKILVESIAASLDLKCDKTRNGKDAIELIQKNSKTYDIILSDVTAPPLNGMNILQNIRAFGITAPFIALTANGNKEMALESLRLGAFDFLEKPVNKKTLVDTIQRALDHESSTPNSADFNDLIKQSKILQSQTSTVKIETSKIECILDLVGELVVIKSQLVNETSKYESNTRLSGIATLLDRTIRELQDKSLSMRMTPLKTMFQKTARIVRDLSLKLNKPVAITMSGEDTEIDRTMVELLADPLMHIARNALDHGIETSNLRKEKKKSEKGNINISAKQVGSRIIVKLSDDGAGLNKEKIVKKAKEKGLLEATASTSTISNNDLFKLIYAPGFSTVDAVTDISGRGVGMNVVKTNIEKIKGNIEIDSVEGMGTNFIISIPLTTSITDGMLVEIKGQSFILQMDCIQELVDLNNLNVIEVYDKHQAINIRGKILPVIELDRVLESTYSELRKIQGSKKSTSQHEMIAVVEQNNKHIAIKLDAVLGQTQVVLKPLGENFKQTNGIAGAAILGDGKIALVLDTNALSCADEQKEAA